jgi:hypothetical protein
LVDYTTASTASVCLSTVSIVKPWADKSRLPEEGQTIAAASKARCSSRSLSVAGQEATWELLRELLRKLLRDFMYITLGEHMYLMDEGTAVAQLLYDAAYR